MFRKTNHPLRFLLHYWYQPPNLLQSFRANTLVFKKTSFQNPCAFHPSPIWSLRSFHCNIINTVAVKNKSLIQKWCLLKSCKHRVLLLGISSTEEENYLPFKNVHAGVQQKKECVWTSVFLNGVVALEVLIKTNSRVF